MNSPQQIIAPTLSVHQPMFGRIRMFPREYSLELPTATQQTVYDKSVYPALHLVPQLTRLFMLGNLQRKTYIPKSIKACTGANGRKALLNSLNWILITVAENTNISLCTNLNTIFPKVHLQLPNRIVLTVFVYNKFLTRKGILRTFNIIYYKGQFSERSVFPRNILLSVLHTLAETVANVSIHFLFNVTKCYKRNSTGQSRIKDLNILEIEHKKNSQTGIKKLPIIM